jgi:hypothetical protein
MFDRLARLIEGAAYYLEDIEEQEAFLQPCFNSSSTSQELEQIYAGVLRMERRNFQNVH